MLDWKASIRKDLVSFANPGTTLDCTDNGNEITIAWASRRQKLKASFEINDGTITVLFDETTMSYASFLASTAMSDMLGIAGMILQMHQETIYVDTKANNPEDGNAPESALSLLTDATHKQTHGSTHVLFINADAGAGKTEVLKQLVLEQATKYIRGEATYLYLYVNAQGRALARLEEALATEIQDLRASNLTYHVVPALTRNNVLVPIIDGFDELLGVMGYEDSFSSLRRFLAELNGQGSLIASARSTYYQQEFLSRANKPSSGLGGITISQIDILPWKQEEFADFLNKRFIQEPLPRRDFESFKQSMTRIFSIERNATLKTKPFFLAAAAALLLDGADIKEDDLIDQLVGGFIERERSEKLLDKQGSPLISTEQIHKFLQMISDEMWAGEVRALDRETVRDLADLAFDSHSIGPEVLQRLRERAGTMAFFTASMYREGVEFEHQLFFSYFLGESVSVSAITNQEELFRTLVRATLPEGAASFAARRLVTSGRNTDDVVSECSGAAGRGSIRPPHLRENAGALIAEFIREDSTETGANNYERQKFRNVVFAGIKFPQIDIKNSSFSNVEFRRSDLSKVKILNCTSDGLILQDTTIDPGHTVLNIEGVSLESSVLGLRIRHEDQVQSIFRLSEVKRALSQCSFPGINDDHPIGIDDTILMLIERLFKKFDKSTVFWPTDELNRNITQDANWDRLMAILISSGLAVQDRVASQSGAPRQHLRVTAPSDVVIRGQIETGDVPEQVRKFWNEVRSIWPAN